MQPSTRLTKQKQRQLMQELMERRESKTPKHVAPNWVAAFWKRIAS